MSQTMKQLIAGLVFVLALPVVSSADEGWKSLFDGKSLSGWTQKNGTAKYTVVDGTIRGETNEGSPNSFLCTDKLYGDFELEFEVKVHNDLNSGVQLRSKTKEEASGKKKERRCRSRVRSSV